VENTCNLLIYKGNTANKEAPEMDDDFALKNKIRTLWL
jgi:hypothetical protein